MRIQGLRRTSFYIPARLLRQFNVPQTIAPIPRDLSAKSVEADVRLTLQFVVMWQERLTHSYGSTELGIAHPMVAAVVQSIWIRVRDRVLGHPY